MATLKCGIFSFLFNYLEFSNYCSCESYTYSLQVKMDNYPLFSDGISKNYLTHEGMFTFTSDDGDHLLEAFKLIVEESSPLDEEICFYSEMDGPQQIIIKLQKTKPPQYNNLTWYYITLYLDSESFKDVHGVGNIQLGTHTIESDSIKSFISEMENESNIIRNQQEQN